MEKIIDNILKETTLKTRLKVFNEMTFINLITELGYRENKMWTDDENGIISKIKELSIDLANDTIEEIEQWGKDGKP